MGAPGLAFETWDPPRKCRPVRIRICKTVLDLQGNSPKTATLFVVPTYTLPLAIMGATNLLSVK